MQIVTDRYNSVSGGQGLRRNTEPPHEAECFGNTLFDIGPLLLDSGNLLALEISHFETDIGFREHQADFQQPVTFYVEAHLSVLMDVLGQVVKFFPKISIPVGNGN